MLANAAKPTKTWCREHCSNWTAPRAGTPWCMRYTLYVHDGI
jgi:hypothetical protein